MKFYISIFLTFLLTTLFGQKPCDENEKKHFTTTYGYPNFARVSRCLLNDPTTNFSELDTILYVDRVIDSSISKLTEAKVIHFINPEIDELPPEIGQLKKLSYVYFELSSFESLPSEFWELPNLEQVHFMKCFHFDSIPNDVSKLKSLKSFSHTYGPTIYLNPKSFENFTQPIMLLFDYSVIDESTYEELQKLKKVYVGWKKR